MKYIDAEKLKAEIKRRIEWLRPATTDFAEGRQAEMRSLYDFIDSLQQEQPSKESLNESQQEFVDIVTERMLKEGPIPTLKGKQKAEFEKEFNRFKQITGMINFPAHMEVYKRIILWFMAWGADNLPNLGKPIDPGRMDIQQEQLPGIEEHGIPGKDFIPVEWVDACEKYGKWKIVQQEQPSDDLEEAAIDFADNARKQLYSKDYAISSIADYDHGCIDGFKAGAEWISGQGAINYWMAKDKDGHLLISNFEPYKRYTGYLDTDSSKWINISPTLSRELFPDIKLEDSPIEVTVQIRKKEK